MKKITFLSILLCLPFVKTNAQSICNNQDFEDTTFFNWVGATGNTPGSFLMANTSWVNGIVTSGPNAFTNDVNNQMTLITQNYVDSIAIDPATSLPDTQMTSLAPNGGVVSVRLGNCNVGAQCERLKFQFLVTFQRNYQYQFATVMEDPGHVYDGQPYFMVNIWDQAGNLLPCCSDTIWSADPAYPFISTLSPSGSPIKYRRWTPVALDLSAYVGQTLTIEYTNSDCAFSGHYGYTYLDISCMGSPINATWPGDTDYDLQANNMDILPLAIAYGANGPFRSNGSNNWLAQTSTNWPQSFAFNMNYKHSDCNGDGTINLDDTLAIVLNYAQNHPYRLGGPPINNVTSNAPMAPLYLVPVNNTVGPFNYVDVDVYAGDSSIYVERLAGIAYTINYDNALIQPGSFSWNFSGSGIGVKNANMIAINHSALQNEDVAQARMAGEVNGILYLGRMHFAVENVNTITNLELNIQNVKAVNSNMVHIPMTITGCNITIDPSLAMNVQNNSQEMHVTLFPNPTNQFINVSTSSIANKINFTDAFGRDLISTIPQSQETKIDVSGFAKGIYFVNVFSENGNSTQLLVISE